MQFISAAEWTARAREARSLAAVLVNPDAKTTMREIADGYERLARHAAQWAQEGAEPERAQDG